MSQLAFEGFNNDSSFWVYERDQSTTNDTRALMNQPKILLLKHEENMVNMFLNATKNNGKLTCIHLTDILILES